MSKAIPILVVEDEAIIRMHLVDILASAGFTTLEVGSAAAAIEVLEKRQDIKAVFTDIEMPGTMDGLALSHYVRHRWPPTIIVIASGRRIPERNDMPEGAQFIGKPFDPAELASVLDDVRRRAA